MVEVLTIGWSMSSIRIQLLTRGTDRQMSRWTDRQAHSHLLIAGDICDGGSFDYRLIYSLYQDPVTDYTDRQTDEQIDRQTD